MYSTLQKLVILEQDIQVLQKDEFTYFPGSCYPKGNGNFSLKTQHLNVGHVV